jgi:branched-subunit amino acid aminotransferase/4-amino-4-deoxychorismate lyase
MKVWIDGSVVEGSQARIPVTDHGFLYGDGVFEGIRLYNRCIFRFDLFAADEVFLTGTGARIVAVGSLDGISIGKGGPGPITRLLDQAFEQCARSTGTPI